MTAPPLAEEPRASWIPAGLKRLLEGFGAVLAVLSGIPLVITGLFVLPHFAAMYAELGAELPAFTQLVMAPGLAIVAGLLPLALAGLVVVRLVPEALRLPVLGFAVMWGMAVEGGVVIALYLPIFGLADAITAE